MRKTGLVTVLYKSDNVLEGFFKSLSIQDYSNYILYLIDNSPSPQTNSLIHTLQEKYRIEEKLRYIANANNVGVAEGNNQGILMAIKDNCDYVLLLNNDIEFRQPYLLSAMVKLAADRHEKIIVPKIFFSDSRTIWTAGGALDKKRALTIHYGERQPDGPQFSTPGYCEYAPTCFMLIEREDFERTGLMDANYFVYYDDTDFIYRAGKRGYRIFYEPGLTIDHKVGNSSGGFSNTYIYYYNRNRLYFIVRNFPFLLALRALTYYMASRIVSFFKLNASQRKVQWKGIRDGIVLCFKKRKVQY